MSLGRRSAIDTLRASQIGRADASPGRPARWKRRATFRRFAAIRLRKATFQRFAAIGFAAMAAHSQGSNAVVRKTLTTA